MINCILRLLAFGKKENIIPRKILFIKLSEIGSIILLYPLLNRARKAHPEAEIFFLTFKKNKPLLQILDPDCNILTIKEDSICSFILDTLRAIRKLRREKIDIAFDLELFSRFTAILNYLSGAAKKVGFYRYSMEGLYRGELLTHKVQYNCRLHISKSYLSLWQAAKAKTKSTPDLEEKIEDKEISLPRFILSEEEKRKVWTKLKGWGIEQHTQLLLLNPGEGNIPLREWPLENFIALTKRLLQDHRNYIIIIGSQGANKKGYLLSRSVSEERCLNLTDKTTITEVLGLFNIAKALIANDSGLAHLASLTPVKKFIFFGPESPHIYSPLGDNTWIFYSDLPCSPCLSAFNHRNSACKNNKCLKIISPDDVYEIIKKNL
jgi:ADP-heptose:LPS heptosyltransferase